MFSLHVIKGVPATQPRRLPHFSFDLNVFLCQKFSGSAFFGSSPRSDSRSPDSRFFKEGLSLLTLIGQWLLQSPHSRLQWPDRSGFSPDSLLGFTKHFLMVLHIRKHTIFLIVRQFAPEFSFKTCMNSSPVMVSFSYRYFARA